MVQCHTFKLDIEMCAYLLYETATSLAKSGGCLGRKHEQRLQSGDHRQINDQAMSGWIAPA